MPDLLPNEPTEEEPVPVQKEQEETKTNPVETKANTTEPEVKVQSLRNKTKKTAPGNLSQILYVSNISEKSKTSRVVKVKKRLFSQANPEGLA